MINILYILYFNLVRYKKKSNNVVLAKIAAHIEDFFNTHVVNSYKKETSNKKGVTKNKRNQKIIVSLTSFPKRINTLWITIETIMRQTILADEIILWLAYEQFPNGLDDLPKSLLNYQKRGLTIRFCDDLRSHKKYYYTMQEYPDDIIILVDDDMFYPSDTVSKLLKMHKKYPNDICVMSSQVITNSLYELPSQWRNPKLDERFESSKRIQIFTGSGSLYVPNCLNKDAFDKELIKTLCPYADDLWLTFMAYKKGTSITAQYKWRPFPIVIYGTSEGSLYYINAEDGNNDEQWQNLINHYPEDFARLEKLYENNR